MGKFSSDRTIRQYNEQIWNVAPVCITREEDHRGAGGD
jgi:hypothetical protein